MANIKDNIVYSTDSFEHLCNFSNGESFDLDDVDLGIDLELDKFDSPSFENPCVCGLDDVYSKTLTNNLCLNCYYEYERSYNEMCLDSDY